MSLAYFPMYPTDFDADTGHLTFAEDGAYNRLLRLQWRCPLGKMPNDIDWICRKVRAATQDEKDTITSIINEFFTRKGGRVFSARLHREWVKAENAHEAKVLAGIKGAAAKLLKANKSDASTATAELKQPEPEPEPEPELSKKREPIGSPKKPSRKCRLPDGWVPSDRNISDAQAKNFSFEEIQNEAVRFRDHHAAKDTTFADWDAGWRTWIGNARKFAAGSRLAIGAASGRNGQGGSIASIVARRRAAGEV